MKFIVYSVTIFLLSASILCGAPQAQSPARIVFFFKPLLGDTAKTISSREELYKFIGTPGKMNRAFIKQATAAQVVSGIYVTYMGSVTHSDFNGEVVFPRQTPNDTLTVIVCNKLKPVMLLGNTINHFAIKADADAAYYTFTRQKNRKLNQYVWHVHQIAVPQNHRIPASALVIIAKPNQIVIMEGTTITTKTPHLVLPDIYVSEKIRVSDNALQFLKINKFFAQVDTAYYYDTKRFTSLIVNS